MGECGKELIHNPERLAALHALRLLDTAREEIFDALTRLAARVLRVPIALISLVDEDRQFFKSSVGLPEPWDSRRAMPISHSFCQYALASSEPLVIDDAVNHELVAGNPAIVDLNARSYLGAPLVTTDGYVLGTFSVIDHVPRKWTREEEASVSDFARTVMTAVELGASLVRINESQAELEAGRNRLKAVVETAPCAIWAVDRRGVVTLWSQGAAQLFDGDERDAIGRPIIEMLDGDLLAIEFRELLGKLESGHRVEGVEVDLRTRSGRKVPVEIWGAPLGQDGRESVMVGFDIRERGVAEEERKELENRTGRDRRMEAAGRLSGVIAHDFTDLLAAIQGYLELARTRDDIELVRLDLMEVANAAQLATKLTRQLLTFGHGQPQSDKTIDVCEGVRDLSDLLEQLVGADRNYRIDFPAAPIFASIEGSALEKVIVNLVINARDATPAGGEVKVSVRSIRNPGNLTRLSDMAPLNGHLCEIVVTDSGAGVPSEIADRIFEPFFTTKEPRGTGLGLATVYSIVHSAGGDVTVESDAEHGSVFRVVLPELIGVDADKNPEPTDSSTDAPRSGTILVVDDEEPFRRSVVEILSRKGYTVYSAPDARRALVLVDARPDKIDLLLTDLAMPGMSGTALASRLSNMPVVFMSGVFTGGDVVGDRTFLQKPFTPDELLTAVERALPATASIKPPQDATRV